MAIIEKVVCAIKGHKDWSKEGRWHGEISNYDYEKMIQIVNHYCPRCGAHLEHKENKLKISERDCSYCGKEKGFICHNDGVCISCAEYMVGQLRTGVRLPWSRESR